MNLELRPLATTAPEIAAARSLAPARWWVLAAGVTAGALTAVHGAAMLPVIGWAALVVAVHLASRTVAGARPLLVPLVVLGGAATLTVVGLVRGDLLDPLYGPLGYANATGAFYVLTAGACLLARSHLTARPLRALLVGLAVASLGVPLGANSRTAALLGVLVLTTALPARLRPRPRTIVAVGALVVVATSLAVVTVARSGELVARLLRLDAAALSPSVTERVRLWAEAVDHVRTAPLVGVGPGRFGPAGTPARVAWEHYAHNEYLQVAAEFGVVALAVALAGVVLVVRRLLAATDRDAAAVGLIVLIAVCLHACVDYVLHVPAVVLTAAAIVGAAAPSGGSATVRRDPPHQPSRPSTIDRS